MIRGSADELLQTRLLLVEDCPDDQRLMAHSLSCAGAEVVLECNGEGAVTRFARAKASGEVFDGVVMDLQMPGMNGIEATRQLRERGYVGPIIAITAHGDGDTERRWRLAGCTSYLTKPYQPIEFVKLVSDSLGHVRVTS